MNHLLTRSMIGRTLVLLLLFSLLMSGPATGSAYAAVVPDKIRVGLFLHAPARNFSATTPMATIQAQDGASIVWQDAQARAAIGQVAPGVPVRFARDGYRAIVLETADFNSAITVWTRLQAASAAVSITKLDKYGKPVYQVAEGDYATAAEANAALGKWKLANMAAGMPETAPAKVSGPWAVESGPYGGLEDAIAAAGQIGATGLDAFAAVKVVNGTVTHVVRVGQLPDEQAAAALQQAVVAAGGFNVRVPAASEPYVLVRQDVTISGASGQPVLLYALPVSGTVTLRAEPAGSNGIRLLERSNRTYRGVMEMGIYGGSLAVINEVPLQQYLYAVVGAEVGASWPAEALKAQAVAARSYALASGMAFDIAHVVDSTRSQVYSGIGAENPNAVAAVDATAGEVLTYNGAIIEAVFSSNAGGMTADNRTEVWGTDTPYLSGAVPSPDEGAQEGLMDWVDVLLDDGRRGYIRSDLLSEAGRNGAGIAIMSVREDGTAVRIRPKVEANVEPIARLSRGTIVVPLGQVPENSAYSWVEAPIDGNALLDSLRKYIDVQGPLQTLEVTGRGPSGRVTEMTVNGTPYSLKVPDYWRSALGGVRSTLLQVEETARMTVLGAGGAKRELPQSGGALHVADAGGTAPLAADANLLLLDASGRTRAVTQQPTFILSVKGYGHGLGMSQYGAKKLAEQGNDYRYILQYYYKNAIIEKGAGE